MSFNKDDCKAIFLLHKFTENDTIKHRNELIRILRETGRHVNDDIITRYWKQDTEDINFTQFLNICRELPIIIKSDLVKQLRSLDTRGLGYLDKMDFLQYLLKTCKDATKKQLAEIVEKADANDDDRLQFEEIASLLLSNLEPFKQMARDQISKDQISTEEQIQRRKSMFVESQPRPSIQPGTNNRRVTISGNLPYIGDNEDEIDSARTLAGTGPGTTIKEIDNGLSIKKLAPCKFNYSEPRNLKSWKRTEMRGCFFLNQGLNDTPVNEEIQSNSFQFTLNADSNVIITLGRPHFISRIANEKPPDWMFIIHSESNKFIGLSSPSDSAGTVFFQNKLSRGTYNIYPFTTGIKWTFSPVNYDWSKIKCVVKKGQDQYSFTPEIRTALEDIFKIFDSNGDGFWNKTELESYATFLDEDEPLTWEEFTEYMKLQNNEIPFPAFLVHNCEDCIDGDKINNESIGNLLEIVGFNEKLQLKNAWPYSLVCMVESADFIFQSNKIDNHQVKVEALLCNFIMKPTQTQDNKIISRNNFPQCAFYHFIRDGLAIVMCECQGASNRMNITRLEVNMEKSINLVWYRNKSIQNTGIRSGDKKILLFGVAYEPKVDISLECFIRNKQ